jgi:probable selenium-dependent hydroxylase accessory protein YqeC
MQLREHIHARTASRRMTDEALLDLLDARRGVICAVGAGGKKSLLQRLALANPARVAITATVPTTYSQENLGFGVVIEPDASLVRAVAQLDQGCSVAYACPSDKPGRRAGASSATIERIHRDGGFAATYVKADGARMRLLKSPAEDEPALPDCATTVLPIVSALALGESLCVRVAHRVEQVAQVTGLRESETILPVHLGRLIASPQGLMKRTAGRRVVPVINMVDAPAREAGAREAAEVALGLCESIDRVVLTCLARDADPVVAVVLRPGAARS